MFLSDALGSCETEAHVQWKRDRAVRCRVPTTDSWRGCVGLAMLLDDPDATEYHGEFGLVRNEDVRWLVVRDIPVGHFPGTPRMDRRPVSLATETRASVRYGMPTIDFRLQSHPSCDFCCLPVPHHRRTPSTHLLRRRPHGDVLDSDSCSREFAILNRISSAMTDFAFRAQRPDGEPLRRAWAARKPYSYGDPFVPTSPTKWMPRAFLAIPATELPQVFDLVTRAHTQSVAFECPACCCIFDGELFRVRQACRTQWVDDGDFMAKCPRCGRRRKWRAKDGRACRIRRDVPLSLRTQFCDALAHGLKLGAIGPEVYCGSLNAGDDWPLGDVTGKPLDLVPHKLKSEIDGSRRLVWLPKDALITAKPGQVLEGGQPWAQALPLPPRAWKKLDRRGRWAATPQVCGGQEASVYFTRCWFEQQAIRLPSNPEHVLFPASLVAVAAAAGLLVSGGLWWETARVMNYYTWQIAAAVFPPLPNGFWDQLRFTLPGEILLDASIADPRCDVNHLTSTQLPSAARSTAA